jgi:hypothetical protein
MKKLSVRIITLLLLLVPVLSNAQCSDLFFSEYMEGSSNNKALEIYNPTSTSIDLSDYLVYRNNNGSLTPSATFSPRGILAPDSVYVIVNASSIPSIVSRSDTTSSLTSFNGDDAVWMKKISTGDTLDIIGVIGFDPGSRWTVGSGSTQNTTLVRKVSVLDGQVDWAIGATEWDVFSQNTEDSLGTHTKNPCPSSATFTVATSVDASPSCIGFLDGAVTATVTGSGTYTYSWSNAATTASITGLAAGTYTVTVSDGTASVVESITISEPTAIVPSISVDARVSASGASDGALTASATGGASGYTYLWSNGASTAAITGLPTGTYAVTVTDGNSCTAAKSTVLGLDLAKLVITEIMYNPAASSDSMEFVEIYNNGSSAADMTGYTISQDIGYTFPSVTINAGEYLLIARDSSAISNVLGLTAYQWTTGNLANAGDQLVLKDNVGNTLDSIDYSDASPWPTGTPSPDGDGPSIELMHVNMDNNVASNWTFSPTPIAGVIENGKQVYGTPGAAFVSPSVADLIITEIMYNPAAGTDSMEFIELYNNGLNAVNMNGYYIAPGINYTFPQVIVNSGSFVLVARDSSAMSNVLGITTAREWTSGDNLSNTAEQLVLKDNRGITLDSLDYDDGSPWPSGTPTPDGDGPSIELLNVALDNNVGSSWIASPTAIAGVIENGKQVYGSPGALFSYPTLANLIVTEIYYNTPGTDSIEYIEILNATNATVKLDGYSFSNGVSYTFGVTDSILAGGYYITALDSTAFFNVFGFKSNSEWSSGNLVNTSELIKIIDPFGRTVDSVQYDDGGVWPSSPDGGGPSLVLCDSLADNSNGANWSAATSATGVTILGSAILANPGNKAPCTVPLTVSITIDSNVTCSGFSNGGATVSVTTGNLGYSYAWTTSTSPVTFGTTASVNGLAAGKYFVTVSDGSGATAVDSVTITEPAALAAATAIDSSVSCNGLSNGGATASATGGTGMYMYAWSTSTSSVTFATTASITGVAAATYTVTITDANGCTDTETATIAEPVVLAASISIDSSVTCNGLSNGGVTVSATGGTGIYTYAWSTSTSSGTFATTASITGLAAETYTVTITDANGCSVTETVIITDPVVLAVSIVIDANVTCNGLSNGGATASATGGTGVYTYAWSTSTSSATFATTASITGLAAETYTVTITDANGCSDTETVIITEPAVLAASTSIDLSVTCNGLSNGGATASATGGTGAYTFAWSTSISSGTFATTASITGLAAATYTVTITDASGCTDTETATITEPLVLVASIAIDASVTCNGLSNGGATASASGGTGVYTYAWFTSTSSATFATTASITGVAAETYFVTTTDANGCSDTETVIITEPVVLAGATAIDSNASCNGFFDGGVTASATGGTGVYTYTWSNSGTTASITGIAAATYTVTITDANGCTDIKSALITEPATLVAATVIDNNVTVTGGSDGGATGASSGGTAPFTYAWSTSTSSSIFATTASITGLMAGTYTITITDGSGCSDTETATITEPAGPGLAATVRNDSNVLCNGGANGGLTALPTGGTSPYTYLWSNGSITASVSGLSATSYTVTITDNVSATTTANNTITEPTAIMVAINASTNVTCNGLANGTVSLGTTGGTTPYTYLWSNSSTTATVNGLAAGMYFATVTDANGCVDTTAVTITEPVGLISSTVVDSNVTINGGSNGGATASASGGTAPYTYLWTTSTSSAIFATTASITGVAAGTYFVTLTDANGCTDSSNVTISQPTAINITVVVDSNVTCNGFTNGGLTATLTGGVMPYNYAWSNGATTASITGLGATTYTLTITDNAGATSTSNAVITEPPLLVASSVVDSNVTCNGLSDGGVTASVNGGTTPYTYLWSNGAATASITGVVMGVYTATVTDANGCATTSASSITEPAVMVSSATVDSNVTINGATNGGATATSTGGTTPYTYIWSTSTSSVTFATTASITGVGVGTYFVTITDANGCNDSSSVTISQPTALVVAVTVDSNVTCNGFTNGGATSNVSGGTAPYTYLWSNAATTPSITGIAAATYTVTITDAASASSTANVSITEPVILVTSLIVDSNVTTNGGTDGGATATVTGGTAPYTYVWSTSTSSVTLATTASITGVVAGTYTASVTDANGCVTTSSVTITQPAIIGAVASLIISEINYNGPEAGLDTSEFIEFVNAGTTTVNLNGYTFPQGVTHTFGPNDSVTAGQYFVVALDSSAFRNRFGFNADAIWTSGGLSNGGEDIIIVDDLGRGIDTVDFDDNTPWPSGGLLAVSPDGGGATIVLCDSLSDNNDGSNWNAATTAVAGQVINMLQVYANPGAGATCISPLITSTTVDSNATCNGLNNGGGTLTVMGGSAPYSYLWSNSVTTSSITGLIAGTYTVTVTDNLGTTALDSVVITEPTVITVTFAVTNTTSTSGADGTITPTVAGGTAPYTYLWSNAATTANITNLSTGMYTVTITDANGCSQVGMTTVQGPAAVILVMDSSNVTCFGAADGTAKTNVSGGALPYIYLWSNAATTDSIGALAAGTYSVTVTDNVGVTTSDSITIVEPTQIQLSLSVTNASAQGASDGAIDLTVVGGTPGFTYNWSASTSSATIATTEDITLLAPGAYSVNVTDTNGCQVIDSASVLEPGAVANLVITEINYNGPEGGTDTSEFIEFTNAGAVTVNLNGYTFVEGVSHTFGLNDSITVGQYFVIAYDSSAFRNRYGIDADAVWNSGGLSNGGEDISLVDNFGRTVDSVDFDDSAPWPANAGQIGPDGNGSSIELQTALTTDNNDGSNWIASALAVPGAVVNTFQVFGSPGNPYTTGINTVNSENKATKIYPNPTRGMITIETTAEVAQRIQLISMEGKVLRDMQNANNQTQLDLSELANGVYFLKVGSKIQKVILSK